MSSNPIQNTGTDTPITETAMPPRGQRAKQDAERGGPDQAGEHQLDGWTQRERDLLGDGAVGDHRAAEIELQHAAEVAAELHPERLVEAHLLADRLDIGAAGRGTCRHGRRIGRHDLQQQKADQQHAQKDGQRYHQSMGDMARHFVRNPPLSPLEQWPTLTHATALDKRGAAGMIAARNAPGASS
jgi:hypothetical protein